MMNLSETNKTAEELINERYVVEKEATCPVCESHFKHSIVRKIKIKNVGSDIDLRHYYEPVDPLYYDITTCSQCGYAADAIFFDTLKRAQRDKLVTELSKQYTSVKYPAVYTAKETLAMIKQAFFCADIKESLKSEKAYLCLKTAWLFRDLGDKEKEMKFLESAALGFEAAYTEEEFPICTMDNYTYRYLIGAINYLCGEYEKSSRWIYEIVAEQNINPRLKKRAEDLKNDLRQKIAEAAEKKKKEQ